MSVIVEFLLTLALALFIGFVTYSILTRALTDEPGRSERWRNVVNRIADRLLLVLASSFVLVMSFLIVTRYLSLVFSRDLAQYDQLVWNSMHGRLLENTFVVDAPLFLGKSFIPILLAFVPIYAVWSHPLALAISQAAAFAAGMLPIYWFARRELGRALALGVAVAYLLSPTIVNSTLNEFHEIALAAPLLAYTTFFLLRNNYQAFLICLGVTLLVKEEIAFIVVGFGAFIFLFQGRRWMGLAVALFGLAWSVLLLQYLIPFFHGSSSFYYFSSGWLSGGASRYGYLGNSLGGILQTIFTQPDVVLSRILTPDKAIFVLHLLVPLVFLPLLGYEVAFLALPTLGYTLLSTYGEQFSIQTYYIAPIVPFLFFAAIKGLARLLRRLPRGATTASSHGALLAMLLTGSVASYFLHTFGPFARWFNPAEYANSQHAALGRNLLRTIPGDATVIAQGEFLAQLSQRQFVYEIPLIPDYRQAEYLVVDRTRDWYQIHRALWDQFLASGYFETVLDQEGYVIARRQPVRSVQIHFADQMNLVGYSRVPADELRGGMKLRPVVEWRSLTTMTSKYRVVAEVADVQGHVWATDDREPQDGTLPTTLWRLDKPVGDQYIFKLPPTMPAGDYQVTLAVYLPTENGNSYLEAHDAAGAVLASDVVLDTIRIEKNKSSFASNQLQIQQPMIVDFEEMRLIGYVPSRETISAGELLQVGLYWRAREKPRGDYIVVIQLRDPDGKIAMESSSRPAADTYATTQWDAGEVLLDWHDFKLPSKIPIGRYSIVAMLRNGATGNTMGEAQVGTIRVVD